MNFPRPLLAGVPILEYAAKMAEEPRNNRVVAIQPDGTIKLPAGLEKCTYLFESVAPGQTWGILKKVSK